MSNTLITIEQETAKWELQQRKAAAFAASSLVPTQYRSQIEKKEGYNTVLIPNPSAVPNCIIAMNMAHRLGADELMVMQNLYIIEGRPSWSSQWNISMTNSCGRFSPLKFKIEDLGNREVDYFEYVWNSQTKKREAVAKKITIHDFSCVAYATEKSTGEILESAKVTIEMAVKEGWYTKTGSKWQTMPEVMLRYRSASFFSSIYAPELKMGLMTVEEAQDTSPVDLSATYPDAVEIQAATTNDSIAKAIKAAKPEVNEPAQSPNIVDGVDQATGEVVGNEGDFEINPAAQAAAQDNFDV